MYTENRGDKFFEAVVMFFVTRWWAGFLLGIPFLASGAYWFWDGGAPFWRSGETPCSTLTMLGAGALILWGLCFLTSGLIHRFFGIQPPDLLVEHWWADLLLGITFLVSGVFFLWDVGTTPWSLSLSLLTRIRGVLYAIVLGLGLSLCGLAVVAAGLSTLSMKFRKAKPPGANSGMTDLLAGIREGIDEAISRQNAKAVDQDAAADWPHD